MKRFIVSACALALVVTSLGCADCNCNKCRNGLMANRGGQGRHFAGRQGAPYGGGGGGEMSGGAGGMATVAYPYYTTRGPRDFLAKNPRGIGP